MTSVPEAEGGVCCGCGREFSAPIQYRHRLLCGDAVSEEDHARLLGEQVADLVLTDPPYGVGVDYGESVDDSADAVRELIGQFMPLILRHKRALIASGQVCLYDYPRPTWILGWVHPAGFGSSPWGFTCFNPILAYGPDPYLECQAGRRPDTLVLATDREGESEHPVVKPMKVWEWVLQRGSPKKGETVFDPFGGSGTTLIACESLARRSYSLEIEPRWCDVALRRFQAYTGVRPVLESTGEPVDFATP